MDLTTRLKLKKPAGTDDFKRIDINANWDILETAPGLFICTSTTRPTWAAGQAGMTIIETDSRRIYEWDGSAWVRLWPQVSQFATASTTAVGTGTLITGMSVSVSPPVDTKYQVTVFMTVISNDILTVNLSLDTTVQSRDLRIAASGASRIGGYAQQWEVTVPAGTHALRVQATASGGVGGNSVHSDSCMRVTEI